MGRAGVAHIVFAPQFGVHALEKLSTLVDGNSFSRDGEQHIPVSIHVFSDRCRYYLGYGSFDVFNHSAMGAFDNNTRTLGFMGIHY